jgi:hypothetical protein
MNIFARPHYQSDVTQFIETLKQQRPELEAQQREGRNLLWDKRIDPQQAAQARQAQVAQKPYVYQTGPSL